MSTNQRRKVIPKKSGDRDSGVERKKFTGTTFESLADDLQSGRIPLDRFSISDDVVRGLRAIIRNTGLISFHVSYTAGESRGYFKIGDYPAMKIDEARDLARTILSLARMGIDAQAGWREQRIAELKAKGTKWRP